MIKLTLFILISIVFSGCVNKRGVSAKYYNDCNEYYDAQGYYHKKCDDSTMITYKQMGDGTRLVVKKVKEGTITAVNYGIKSTKSLLQSDEEKYRQKQIQIQQAQKKAQRKKDRNVW